MHNTIDFSRKNEYYYESGDLIPWHEQVAVVQVPNGSGKTLYTGGVCRAGCLVGSFVVTAGGVLLNPQPQLFLSVVRANHQTAQCPAVTTLLFVGGPAGRGRCGRGGGGRGWHDRNSVLQQQFLLFLVPTLQIGGEARQEHSLLWQSGVGTAGIVVVDIVFLAPCKDARFQGTIRGQIRRSQGLPSEGTSVVMFGDPSQNGTPIKRNPRPAHERTTHNVAGDRAQELIGDRRAAGGGVVGNAADGHDGTKGMVDGRCMENNGEQ